MNLDDATLSRLNQLCDDSDGPWTLVPSAKTTTGTIVLHDCHGASIADLYTERPACPCDELIALAPATIAALVAEVWRLRNVIAVGGAMYRAERCSMDIPGGHDPEQHAPSQLPSNGPPEHERK